MEVLLLTEDSRAGAGRWLPRLLLLTGALLLLAVSAHYVQRRLQTPPPVPAVAPAGLLVPSPNDTAWVDYYRSHRDGVAMAVHLPSARAADGVVVWEKYVEQNKAVVALAEIHYDCQHHTRRSARMAVYREGNLDGVAALPGGNALVPVAADSVENDALVLVCSGKAPDVIDDDN